MVDKTKLSVRLGAAISTLMLTYILTACDASPWQAVPTDTALPPIFTQTYTPVALVCTPTTGVIATSTATATLLPTDTPEALLTLQEIQNQFTQTELSAFLEEKQAQLGYDIHTEYNEVLQTLTVTAQEQVEGEGAEKQTHQAHYFVQQSKDEDGKTVLTFRCLADNLQLDTFRDPKAVEFTLSKEYQNGLQDYLNAMGLEKENVATTEEVKVINGQEYRFLVAQSDGINYHLPLFMFENSNWRISDIKDLDVIVPVGTTVSFGDKNSSSSEYRNAANDFSFVQASSPFGNRYIDKYPPDSFITEATNNNQGMIILQLFFHHDLPESLENFQGSQDSLKAEVDKHFTERSRTILKYVVQYNLQGKVALGLANEPFEQTSWVPTRKSPYQKAHGNQWINRAYISLVNVAINEFHLKPGKDFDIIGINVAGMERSGAFSEFVIKEVNRIKSEIAVELGVSPEQIFFDIGMEYHLGKATSVNVRNATLLLKYLNSSYRSTNIDHLQDITRRTGSRIRFTEVDAIGDKQEVADSFAELIRIAVESGVVDSITFYHVLSWDRLNSDADWQNPIFDDNYTRSIVYYRILSELFAIISNQN